MTRTAGAVLSLSLLGLFGVACKPSPQDAGVAKPIGETKNMEIYPETAARMAKMDEVSALMRAEDYVGAEALVDQELGNPGFGTYMAECKAELLAKRGEDAEALDMYLVIFAGQHGDYTPFFSDIAEAFLLAEELERWADADTIATLLLANQSGGFGNYTPLKTPTAANTPNERLAYTYLAIAMSSYLSFEAVTEADFAAVHQKQVEYCLQAKALLPNSTIVLVQTALAYHNRDGINGIEQCRTLLTRAYNQETGNSEMQAEIQAWARVCGAMPLP